MKLFNTIFHFEWIQLKRQKTQWISLFVFFIIGCYATYAGHRTIQKQNLVLTKLQQQYNQDHVLTLQKFTDTLTAETKAQAAQAGMAQIINFRMPPLALDHPHALATLSIGQRDVNPYYQKVKSSVNYLDQENVEISNPAQLFAGNFDLAFVLIYLLPLLIITLCYPTYAEEKEQGTYALLSIQASNLTTILNYKLLFRLTVVLGLVLLLNLVGFAVAGQQTVLSLSSAMLWLWLSLAYIAFWFAICYFFLQFKRSSIVTALQLIGAWLFFLILLPSLTNSYISLKHPIPLRASLASYQRHVSEEVWEMKPIVLADSFNRYNPQYNSSINLAKDSTKNGERFIAGYYDLSERKVARFAKHIDQQLVQKNQMAAQLAVINPSIQLQYLFNALAHTGRNDHQNFKQAVSRFQKEWKHHLLRYQLTGTYFTPAELKQLPKFKLENDTNNLSIWMGSLSLWIGTMLFLMLSLMINKKN
ncbi:DUF3526 domain-containing protein [Pedobacter sp. Hv1]|uniref:DUF3526 domain-containing protein n=1 Tax=Pedobacter sp. Hv1 TaxID=1740090 RepID=UPI0006D89185|nr:DUF3526 domain-containing protein [Pedobacter sp. Hv1]KQC01739.1 hypothetical protein AQF98_05040 [Pedobacter sp. Hv1]